MTRLSFNWRLTTRVRDTQTRFTLCPWVHHPKSATTIPLLCIPRCVHKLGDCHDSPASVCKGMQTHRRSVACLCHMQVVWMTTVDLPSLRLQSCSHLNLMAAGSHFMLFAPCDLDLHLHLHIYELYLTVVKMYYLHTKNELSTSRLSSYHITEWPTTENTTTAASRVIKI